MNPLQAHFINRIRTIYHSRYEPEYARAFADLFWRTLLVIAAVIVVGACVSSAALFFDSLDQLSHNSGADSVKPAPSALFDRTQLDATLADFKQRAITIQALQNSPVKIIADPSK